MIDCTPNGIAKASACYCWFSARESDAAIISALCVWASNLEPVGQFHYEPESELVLWHDGSGSHTGDLAAFRSTADIATTTFIKFNSPLITSITGFIFLPALQQFEGGPNPWLVTDLDFTGCLNLQKVTIDTSASTVTLNASGCSSLTDLICPLNQLISLNVTGCTSLVNFDCDTNPNLTTITGLSTCSSLSVFVCFACDLTGPLNLSGFTNLTALGCYNNNLTSVNVSGDTALTFLNCSSNPALTTLTMTGCTALTTLDCNSCALAGLDVTTCTALDSLTCFSNPFGTNHTLDLSNCTVLNNLIAYLCPGIQVIDMTNIVNMTGGIVTHSNTGLTTITTPDIVHVFGDLALYGCTNLSIVSFPATTDIDGDFNFYQSGMTSVSLPLLTQTHNFNGNNCTSLLSVIAPALIDIFNALDLTFCTSLTSATFTALTNPSGGTLFSGCTSLVTLSFPAVNFNCNGIDCSGCSSLTTFSMPNQVEARNANFTGCALLQASVDGLLSLYATLVGIPSVNEPFTLDTSGGTSQAPSASGLLDKATINAFNPGVDFAITN